MVVDKAIENLKIIVENSVNVIFNDIKPLKVLK
jgi:hypothetical protein